jgi:hypothetical protein
MDQAVSLWSLTAETCVRAWVSPCGVHCGQCGINRSVLRTQGIKNIGLCVEAVVLVTFLLHETSFSSVHTSGARATLSSARNFGEFGSQSSASSSRPDKDVNARAYQFLNLNLYFHIYRMPAVAFVCW